MKQVYIFEKREIALKEENDNTSYVQPTSTNNTLSTMTGAVEKSLQGNKLANKMVVPLERFDGNKTDDGITLDVTAQKDSASVTKAVQDAAKNPVVNNALKGDDPVNVNVNFEAKRRNGKRLNEMRKNSIHFTKSELDNFLRSL